MGHSSATWVWPPRLADRLSTLVEQGLLKRVRYRTDPDWYEYRLTPAGFELFPVILAIKAWSDQYLLNVDAPTLDVHHHTCGAETDTGCGVQVLR